MHIHEQLHGYKFGHELLAYSTRLERDDQDVIDRLSDLAGPLTPGEEFAPYLTCYPLPSGAAYVVARTWQDLSAPRAGCVLTRSLIVPMHAWSGGGYLTAVVALLARAPSRDRERELKAHVVNHIDSLQLPPLLGAPYLELAEALFLEPRRPIVVFDLVNADTAALRLLKAIWPGLRRMFAICTRACSPRQIGGKPFDLLFAPASSRINFGRWEDRRVDGAAVSYRVRHRWTEDIAERVFSSPRPYTIETETQDLFSTESTDESALRLSLLWSELLTRSEVSPFAALGLLDIVDLLNKSNSLSEFPAVEVALDRSLNLAADTYEAGEFFDFVLAFLGKFSKKLPTKALLRRVRRLVATAAADHHTAAIDFLHRVEGKGSELPVIVAAGLGDGLARRVEQERLSLYEIDVKTALALISYSRPFSNALVKSLELRGSQDEVHSLARSLDTKDAEIKSRARRHLIPNFTQASSLPILKALLDGAPASALLRATRALWKANKLSIPEFDNVLVKNAAPVRAVPAMRSLLLELPTVEGVERTIVSSLSLDFNSFEWLEKVAVSASRRSHWVVQLLAKASDGDLKRLPADLADVVVRYLAYRYGSDDAAEQAARVVIHSAPSVEVVLLVAGDLIQHSDLSRARDLASVALSRLLKEPESVSIELALACINNFAPLVQTRDLLTWLTPLSGSVERVSDNLRLLASADSNVRTQITDRIDVLTERIASRNGRSVRPDAVSSWASLIRSAGAINLSTQLRAASDALKYAFDRKHDQVSALVTTSFPVVYAHVANDVETPTYLNFFSFMDWDRCQTLRTELIDAYMRSAWPPHELMLIAAEIEQFSEIVESLLQRYRGGEYFEKILAASESLPDDQRAMLEGVRARRQRRYSP